MMRVTFETHSPWPKGRGIKKKYAHPTPYGKFAIYVRKHKFKWFELKSSFQTYYNEIQVPTEWDAVCLKMLMVDCKLEEYVGKGGICIEEG